MNLGIVGWEIYYIERGSAPALFLAFTMFPRFIGFRYALVAFVCLLCDLAEDES